jgi:type VI secretion system protein ImpC
MPTRLELDLTTGSRPHAAHRQSAGAPLRLLLCGDFSGRAGRGRDEPDGLATRPLLRVDVDNLDAVMARLAPAVELPVDGRICTLGFATLDDFHPDRLLALGELQAGLDTAASPAPAAEAQARPAQDATTAESDAAMLERLLGHAPTAPRAAASMPTQGSVATAVDALVRRIVSADAASTARAEPARFEGAVNAVLAERLRALLHDPGFQGLEAAWRSVQLLVSRLALDGEIELHLFDVTRAELAAAAAEPDLAESGLWKALVERGDAGWGLLVSLEQFDASAGDVRLLATLATTAAAAGGPIIAGAAPRLFGYTAWPVSVDADDWPPLDAASAAHWQALRASPLARWIGLVAPGLMLRLPYGADTDPIDAFDFDEVAGADPAQALLRGPAAVACALLAGEAFQQDGWQLDLDAFLDIDDLPAWVYDDDGERHLYPVTGAWMGERTATAMLGYGVMPLLSRRDRPAARLLRWQSVAAAASALAGAWSR